MNHLRVLAISHRSKSYTLNSSQPIEIGSYDYLSNINLQMPSEISNQDYGSITKDGEQYSLLLNVNDNDGVIAIVDSNNNEIISVPLETLFDSIYNIGSTGIKGKVSSDKLTFDFENSAAKLRVVFQNVSIYDSGSKMNRYANVYILFAIK